MVNLYTIAASLNPPLVNAAGQYTDQAGLPSGYNRNCIARTSSGRIWVCYTDADNTQVLMAYSDTNGTTWVVDATVDNGTTGVTNGLMILLDPTTEQPVVMAVDMGTSRRGRFTKRDSGGSWSAWADMSTGDLTGGSDPVLGQTNQYYSGCVDSDGNLHFLAKQNGGASVGDGIYVTNASGSWVAHTIFTDGVSQASFVGALCADDQGNIHLFYTYLTQDIADGYFWRYIKKTNSALFPELNNGSGSPAAGVEIVQTSNSGVIFDGFGVMHTMIDMALDDDGEAHVCWVETIPSSGRKVTVRYARKVAGIWTPETVETDLDRSHFAPTIAVNQNGDVFISWQESNLSGNGDSEIVIAKGPSPWSISAPFSVAGDDDCWPSLMHCQALQAGDGSYPGISNTGYVGVYCDFDSASPDFDYKIFTSDDWTPYVPPPAAAVPPAQDGNRHARIRFHRSFKWNR